MYVLWIAATVLLVAVEAATVGLTCIWFALGSAAALIASLAGLSPAMQLAVFVIVSALSLIFLKPFATKHLYTNRTATNADRVIGQHGVVTQAIDNEMAEGQVRVSGQIWTARSSNDNIRIPCGTLVTVQQISGVKLIVDPANEEKECNV